MHAVHRRLSSVWLCLSPLQLAAAVVASARTSATGPLLACRLYTLAAFPRPDKGCRGPAGAETTRSGLNAYCDVTCVVVYAHVVVQQRGMISSNLAKVAAASVHVH